jgi:hypothetical protein
MKNEVKKKEYFRNTFLYIRNPNGRT